MTGSIPLWPWFAKTWWRIYAPLPAHNAPYPEHPNIHDPPGRAFHASSGPVGTPITPSARVDASAAPAATQDDAPEPDKAMKYLCNLWCQPHFIELRNEFKVNPMAACAAVATVAMADSMTEEMLKLDSRGVYKKTNADWQQSLSDIRKKMAMTACCREGDLSNPFLMGRAIANFAKENLAGEGPYKPTHPAPAPLPWNKEPGKIHYAIETLRDEPGHTFV